ncbi:hypothetical protein IMG5_158660 [Ichthyophthirius multifiliis]|uniref:Transmembrane protein n=1 Tax=Ichthyophthirius multifiliis TaxID=5932 RepID=G0QZP1_ICHMU|nr:hypothetical protein IMG5_158660 [Ichthyophthirius multifiliis]EGR29315.1 hypothetical protein IMG5_158660 [Ichthyophthirius multifiliis]|eukprot:XP_004030551.1 hypothetical protein IMG5_158660 [Ichthyophthirius multifiliis]
MQQLIYQPVQLQIPNQTNQKILNHIHMLNKLYNYGKKILFCKSLPLRITNARKISKKLFPLIGQGRFKDVHVRIKIKTLIKYTSQKEHVIVNQFLQIALKQKNKVQKIQINGKTNYQFVQGEILIIVFLTRLQDVILKISFQDIQFVEVDRQLYVENNIKNVQQLEQKKSIQIILLQEIHQHIQILMTLLHLNMILILKIIHYPFLEQMKKRIVWIQIQITYLLKNLVISFYQILKDKNVVKQIRGPFYQIVQMNIPFFNKILNYLTKLYKKFLDIRILVIIFNGFQVE